MTAPPPALITATAAAALLSANPHGDSTTPLIIDARPPALHALERLRNAIPPPPPTTLSVTPARLALIYDSGTQSLTPPFTTPAARHLHALHPHAPPHLTLALIVGGLPALRAAAPHHVVFGPTDPSTSITTPSTISPQPPHIPEKLAHLPWAVAAYRAEYARSLPPAQILPNLFVGPHSHANDPVWLSHNAITHILAVGDEFHHPPQGYPAVKWMQIAVRDAKNQNLLPHFLPAIHFISTALQKPQAVVLVHCMAGASRSVATVAAFLVHRGWHVDDALSHIRSLRPAADPNPSFITQLHQFHRLQNEPPAPPPTNEKEKSPPTLALCVPQRQKGSDDHASYGHVGDDEALCVSSACTSFDELLPSSPMTPVGPAGARTSLRPLVDWLEGGEEDVCILPPPAVDGDRSGDYRDDCESMVSDDVEDTAVMGSAIA